MMKRAFLLGVISILMGTVGFAVCGATSSTPIVALPWNAAGSMIGCNPALLPNLYYFIAEVPASNISQYNDLTPDTGVDMGTVQSIPGNVFICSNGNYIINSNWNKAGYDNCPTRLTASDRAVLIVLDRLSDGTTGHFTNMLIARKRYLAAGFTMQTITNGVACSTFPSGCMPMIPVPVPQITGATRTAASIIIDISWNRPTFGADPAYWVAGEANLPAAGDHTADLDRVINGYQVYYKVNDANSAPTTSAVGSWNAVGPIVDYNPATASHTATITIPNTGCSGGDCLNDYAWLTIGLSVNDLNGPTTFALPFVSGNSLPIAPTPTVFASFAGQYATLQQINLNWVTASETDAIGFNLYRSIDGANWTKVNSALIPAKGVGGAGASYAYNDNLPKQRVYQPFKYKIEEMSNTGTRIDETTTDVTK